MPSLSRSVGFGLVCSSPFGFHAGRIERGSLTVDDVGLAEIIKQAVVKLRPALRFHQSRKRRQLLIPRPQPHLLQKLLPMALWLQDEKDARKGGAVLHDWSAFMRLWPVFWE
ncbi:uncharacterized protein CMC5_066560 [Chondromyces crocatus]|uniref:Uncharacterized protein n=1 Tax=Chondromyces crocatus TaxID=52 RepID=A0A0K1ENC0_CHOCO|nr:uncharacterized protein CMC5_066560 [Chondromyces crocatus]